MERTANGQYPQIYILKRGRGPEIESTHVIFAFARSLQEMGQREKISVADVKKISSYYIFVHTRTKNLKGTILEGE